MIYGYGEGWQRGPSCVVDTGLSWRWTSERSVLRHEGPPEAVKLTMRGESPLRYFDPRPDRQSDGGRRNDSRSFSPTTTSNGA